MIVVARLMTSNAKCSRCALPEPTISAGFAKALFEFSLSHGADRATLLRESRLHESDLSKPDSRLPLERYLLLLETARVDCREPALSLLFGEAYALSELSIVGHIGLAAKTVGEAFAAFRDYAPLMMDAGDDSGEPPFEISKGSEGIRLDLVSEIYRQNPLLVESAFARTQCFISKMFEGRSILKGVHFMQSEPSYRIAFDRIFDCPVKFECKTDALLLDDSVMSEELPPSDEYVSGILGKHADDLLELNNTPKSLGARVSAYLSASLAGGAPESKDVARELGLSQRTLHRKLKLEGTSYSKILRELRREKALQFLSGDSNMPLQEIAHRVGFSDATAFSRAVKRWYGKTPGEIRSGE